MDLEKVEKILLALETETNRISAALESFTLFANSPKSVEMYATLLGNYLDTLTAYERVQKLGQRNIDNG